MLQEKEIPPFLLNKELPRGDPLHTVRHHVPGKGHREIPQFMLS